MRPMLFIRLSLPHADARTTLSYLQQIPVGNV